MFACCLLFSQSKLCHIIKAAIIILIMYTVQLLAEGGTRSVSDVCNSLFQSHRDEASFQSPAFRFLCFRHKTISGLQTTPRQSHRSQVNQLSFISFPGRKIVLFISKARDKHFLFFRNSENVLFLYTHHFPELLTHHFVKEHWPNICLRTFSSEHEISFERIPNQASWHTRY